MSIQSHITPLWYPIDVAGTIFPAARTRTWNNSFRIAFLLKEEAEPERLRRALADAQKRFPSFFVRLRRGLFWYYIQPMDSIDVLAPETDFPCRSVDIFSKTRPGLRVYYDRRRVSIEFPHFITDGGAGLSFTKSLLARYLQLGGATIPADSGLLDITESPHMEELEDSFRKNYTKRTPKPAATHSAWSYHPPVEQNYLKLIRASIPAQDLLSLAKKRGLTLTDYLAGAFFYAFYHGEPEARRSRKPIQISVPISLRNYYPTQSLRNFSLFTVLGFHPNAKENFTFDDILEALKGQLDAGKSKEEVHRLLCSCVELINSIPARFVPNLIKRRVMKAGYYLKGEKNQTSSMSNLGQLKLPPCLAEHCDTFEFITDNSPTMPLKLSVLSDEQFVHLFFTSATSKTEVQQNFIRLLTKEGARVHVDCNIPDKGETL